LGKVLENEGGFEAYEKTSVGVTGFLATQTLPLCNG